MFISNYLSPFRDRKHRRNALQFRSIVKLVQEIHRLLQFRPATIRAVDSSVAGEPGIAAPAG